MAYPVVLSITPSINTSLVTSHPITMPAVVVAGNMLVVEIGISNARLLSAVPTGWVIVESTLARFQTVAKIADGTEGGTTVNFTTASSGRSTALTYRISGTHSSVAGGCEAGVAVLASTTAPNPPNLAPSWGSDETLWICGYGQDATAGILGTAAPTNYTGYTESNEGVNSNEIALFSAQRDLTAASENPGTFSTSGGSRNVNVNTIAIRPGVETHSGSGTLAATAGLTGSGHKETGGTGTLAATAGLSGSGSSTRSGSGTLAATAVITASGYQPEIHGGSGAFSASAGLVASGSKVGSGSATLSAVAVLTASGEAIFPQPGYARLSASSPSAAVSAATPDAEVLASTTVAGVSASEPGTELSASAPSARVRTIKI